MTDDLATLMAELGDRQDRAVERLTGAIAKVLSEASRAEAKFRADQMHSLEQALLHAIDGAAARASSADRSARHDDADALRSELAALLGALQAGVVERVGQTSSAESDALRSALSSGFNRVGDRVTEALRSEITRLEVSLLERLPRAPDGSLVDPREELLAELGQIREAVTGALEQGFTSMRTTLAEVAHDGRAAADGVAAIVGEGFEPLRAEIRASGEQVAHQVADLRRTVEKVAAADRTLTEERVEQLRTELVVSLGALEEAYRGPVEALRPPLDAAVAAVEAASMARALEATTIQDEIAAGLTALQARLDDLRGALSVVERTQGDLRRLVGQLWGEEPADQDGRSVRP